MNDSGTVRATMLPLVIAAVLVVVSAAMLLLSSWRTNLVGYAFAAPLPFVLVVLQRRDVVRQREQEGLAVPRQADVLALLILVVGFGIALIHGFTFAYEVARQ